MSIFTRRPREDVETERARLMARIDVRGHEQTIERIQRNAEREERLKLKKQKRADRIEFWASAAKAAARFGYSLRQRLTLILPLLFVNAFAVVGQAGFAHDHLHWQLLAAAGFAATLESIALYIGYHAHAALMAGDSAMKLRLASYLMGAVIGGINYDHYAAPGGKPTAMAVIFGLLSLISPWLWAMHGRHMNRKRLRELGLIDERAPHFSAAKWLHFPVQTLGALRYGIAHNLKDPAAAWDGYQTHRAAVKAQRKAEKARKRLAKDKRPAVRVTIVRIVDHTIGQPEPALRVYRIDHPEVRWGLPIGSESGPRKELESGPNDDEQSGPKTGPGNGSDDTDQDRSGTGNGSGSGDRSHDDEQTGPKKRTGSGRRTGPRKARKTGSARRSGTDFDELLERARDLDAAHLQDRGKHISADNLRAALRIGKPVALELVKQVRGGHIDVAK